MHKLHTSFTLARIKKTNKQTKTLIKLSSVVQKEISQNKILELMYQVEPHKITLFVDQQWSNISKLKSLKLINFKLEETIEKNASGQIVK